MQYGGYCGSTLSQGSIVLGCEKCDEEKDDDRHVDAGRSVGKEVVVVVDSRMLPME